MGSVDQPHGVLVFVASQIYLRESAALCWDSLGSVRPVEWAEGSLSPRPSPQILDRRRAYSLRVSRFGVTLLRGRSLEDGSFRIWSDGPYGAAVVNKHMANELATPLADLSPTSAGNELGTVKRRTGPRTCTNNTAPTFVTGTQHEV